MINFKTHKLCLGVVALLLLATSLVFVACSDVVAPNGFATDGDAPHVTYSEIDLALNIVPGAFNARIIGSKDSIGAVSLDIWDGGGNLEWAETADTVEFVSDSAADDVGGLGASSIRVTGLDVNFDHLVEILVLDGLTPVTTVGEYSRINQALVTSVGVYDASNVGLITGTHNGCSCLQILIQPDKNISHKTHFTIPNGHTAIIRNIIVITDTTKVATYEFLVRPNLSFPPTAPFLGIARPLTLGGIAATTELRILNGREIPGKTDFWIQGSGTPPGGFVVFNIDMIIIDQDRVLGSVNTACEIAC